MPKEGKNVRKIRTEVEKSERKREKRTEKTKIRGVGANNMRKNEFFVSKTLVFTRRQCYNIGNFNEEAA